MHSKQFTRDVKVIRAVWGNFDSLNREIPRFPIYDEVVFVWGKENSLKLAALGYQIRLVSESSFVYEENRKFFHKIDCFYLASLEFSKFLFLDWDVVRIRDWDEELFSSLEKSKFQMPLYAHPIKFLEMKGKIREQKSRDWIDSHIDNLEKYSWKEDDLIVSPNACFAYFNNSEMPLVMMNISRELNLSTTSDEFSAFMATNCSLRDYIEKYDPYCIFGRPADSIFTTDFLYEKVEIKLHKKILAVKEKKEYFLHI